MTQDTSCSDLQSNKSGFHEVLPPPTKLAPSALLFLQEEAMFKRLPYVVGLLLLLAVAACRSTPEPPEDWLILAEFGEDFPLDRVSTEGAAKVSLVRSGGMPAVQKAKDFL